MGTTYAVTIADPPATLAADWQEQIEDALKIVNQQMSTYQSDSEITRFNESSSTDWFSVSLPFAQVVAAGLEVSRASQGAFDITVGPLVDAWSFGPGKRSSRPPAEETIESLRKQVGYRHLSVRFDPPALKKELPSLRVDLSAIAKGYGVDRLIELLEELGCQHALVDIGGEDRAMGRRGSRAWRVAVEDPTEDVRQYHYAIDLVDRAIATSGDYRNFFLFEGVRYSHTIDPRTGRPVDHDLALVSVLADSCMEADAWATALNVLGQKKGQQLAADLGIAARFVQRIDDNTFDSSQTTAFPANVLTPLAE